MASLVRKAWLRVMSGNKSFPTGRRRERNSHFSGPKQTRQTLSEWLTIRKPLQSGFPLMVVGYMRVSSDGERQALDLQRDALLAAGMDERHLFEDIAPVAARGIGPVWREPWRSSGRAIGWSHGSWIASADRCRTCWPR